MAWFVVMPCGSTGPAAAPDSRALRDSVSLLPAARLLASEPGDSSPLETAPVPHLLGGPQALRGASGHSNCGGSWPHHLPPAGTQAPSTSFPGGFRKGQGFASPRGTPWLCLEPSVPVYCCRLCRVTQPPSVMSQGPGGQGCNGPHLGSRSHWRSCTPVAAPGLEAAPDLSPCGGAYMSYALHQSLIGRPDGSGPQ